MEICVLDGELGCEFGNMFVGDFVDNFGGDVYSLSMRLGGDGGGSGGDDFGDDFFGVSLVDFDGKFVVGRFVIVLSLSLLVLAVEKILFFIPLAIVRTPHVL